MPCQWSHLLLFLFRLWRMHGACVKEFSPRAGLRSSVSWISHLQGPSQHSGFPVAWLWVLAGGQAAASRVSAVRAGGGLALSAVAPHTVGGFVLLSEHGREEAFSLLFSTQRVFALWGTRPVLGVVLPPSPAGSPFYQISGPSGQPHSATVTPFLCTGTVFAGRRPEFWHQSFTAWLDSLAPFLHYPDRSKQALSSSLLACKTLQCSGLTYFLPLPPSLLLFMPSHTQS